MPPTDENEPEQAAASAILAHALLRIRRAVTSPLSRPPRYQTDGGAAERKLIQKDGRLRLYGYAPGLDRYLRVVLLPGRETVHNAFVDEDFRP